MTPHCAPLQFTPDDLENTAVVLVFVDPTSPAALDGLGRLQDVSAEAGVHHWSSTSSEIREYCAREYSHCS